MKTRFPITEQPILKPFVLASLVLHLVVMTIHGFLPVDTEQTKPPPPIKVSYVPPPKPAAVKKPSTLIDAPKPKRLEKPKRSDFLSSHNSRAHSNRKPSKSKIYKKKRTIVPKVSGLASLPKKVKKHPKKKPIPQPPQKSKRKIFRSSDKGFAMPPPKERPAEKKTESVAGSSLALLDGFDAEKYAALDTQAKENEDDDDLISLDTRETKYASYFSRIKHQIERVWSYPNDAARKGVSGKLSLRFRLSKDGNLVDVQLLDTSGSNILDAAAVEAVKGAAPFYPFPVTIDRETLSILATFVYNPTYNAKHQVRYY